MQNFEDFIPDDKYDIEAVNRLQELEYPAYRDILHELMGWTRDIDCPVARALPEVLLAAGKDLVPHIEKVIETGDHAWIISILRNIVKQMEHEEVDLLKKPLYRMAFSPTPDEKKEGLDAIAGEILENFYAS